MEEEFELGFHINNLVELWFLKIFYMCLTLKKKRKKKAKVRILVGIII
jgi:hypothetical protein